MPDLTIRPTTPADLPALKAIHVDAFGPDKGPELAQLVADLLADPTAKPLLSLAAEEAGELVAHVLLTHATLDPPDEAAAARLLAPLAVRQANHGQGVGTRLVEAALAKAAEEGIALVFVLGHPSYYPRFGFRTAGPLGLGAPLPVVPEDCPAWMVRELQPGAADRAQGTLRCAAALNHPHFWVE